MYFKLFDGLTVQLDTRADFKVSAYIKITKHFFLDILLSFIPC